LVRFAPGLQRLSVSGCGEHREGQEPLLLSNPLPTYSSVLNDCANMYTEATTNNTMTATSQPFESMFIDPNLLQLRPSFLATTDHHQSSETRFRFATTYPNADLLGTPNTSPTSTQRVASAF